MAVNVDLDSVILDLESRYDDIRKYTLDTKGPPLSQQRDQITEWLTALSKDITVLSAIRANQAAAQVTVMPPTPQDEAQLRAALSALSVRIQNNQAFNNFILAVTGALGAADTAAANIH